MYTIKEASARTGVGAPLIRAWERRYGVITPTRTASGYRLYDETSLKVLLAMRSLVDSGWTASEAARAITAGEVSVDEAAVAARGARAAVEQDAALHRSRMVERFVAAAEAASPADTESSLDEILASGSFEAVADDLLLPAVAALGDAWAAGRLSVGGEHAASAAVARRLASIYQAAGVPGRVSVVVGLPPGAHHELGALAFAAALRRRGTGVLYLGADVTVGGWIDAVSRTHARAAVIGIITAGDQAAAREVISALRAEGVSLIAVGGAASGDDPAFNGVAHLPERVVDAAATVADLVARAG
jgi:DNA-binding transcriptional MerR regulator/methylmalonyl-CoA mutase cobalamin-binding subunit